MQASTNTQQENVQSTETKLSRQAHAQKNKKLNHDQNQIEML
ncbi:11423_t:CDS:1, partial [Racocetra fulgida]